MTGISPVSWQQECALSHLRSDAKELLRLHKYHGDLTPDWLGHMKESAALLQRIIDAHVLQPVQTHLQADKGQPAVALAVHEEQEA